MKTLIKFLFLFLFLYSCEIEDDSMTPNPLGDFAFENIAIGPGGDYYNADSWRNHIYEMDINQDNAIISINATFADINGRIMILDSARNPESSSGNPATQVRLESVELDNMGKYFIVVAIEEDQEGSYTLIVNGEQVNEIFRVPAQIEGATGQEWTEAGGYYEPDSYRNVHFSFDVLEDDQFVDVVLKSQGTNSRLYILNSARGTDASSGNPATYSALTHEFEQAGSYSIVVCSEENSSGTFDLSIFSRENIIANFQKIESTTDCQNGSWIDGGGFYEPLSPNNKRFTFSVLEPTYIDVTCASTGTNNRISILDSAGNQFSSSGNPSVNTLIAEEEFNLSEVGEYTIAVMTEESNSGNFELCITSRNGTITGLTPE